MLNICAFFFCFVSSGGGNVACQMVEWSVRAACEASIFRRRTHNPVSLCSFRVVDEYVLSP